MVCADQDYARVVVDPASHRPGMAEGVAHLDHLIAHGPSDYAFSWQDVAGARLWKTARRNRPNEHAA